MPLSELRDRSRGRRINIIINKYFSTSVLVNILTISCKTKAPSVRVAAGGIISESR